MGSGDSQAKRRKVEKAQPDEVALFHLLKKHKDCRDPKTCKGVKATCTKGKAKTQVESLRKRVEGAASAVQAFADIARDIQTALVLQKAAIWGKSRKAPWRPSSRMPPS